MVTTKQLKILAEKEQARLKRNKIRREQYKKKKKNTEKEQYILQEAKTILQDIEGKLTKEAKKGKKKLCLMKYYNATYSTHWRGGAPTTYRETDGWEPDYMREIVDILEKRLKRKKHITKWIENRDYGEFCVIW